VAGSLPEDDRRRIGIDLATIQVGWPVGMPLCRPLGDGLWEVPSRRIAHVVFFLHAGRIGVVHGFIKKTQKTPPEELELARKRKQEMET
jgi:phage-related protein